MSEDKRLLIFSDVHAPYHDKRAWQVLIDTARVLRPHILVNLGDFADCYAVSAHDKDPRRRYRFAEEATVCRNMLREISGACGPQLERKVYCLGNHENRLERLLMQQAPQLMDFVDIDKVLCASADGWRITPYRDLVEIGKVSYTHDLEKTGRTQVLAAAVDAHCNIVIGHGHRMCYSVEGDAKGVARVAASFGWLGDVNKADYMHKLRARREWTHGFGVGILRPNGVTHLFPVPIVSSHALVPTSFRLV